LQACRQFYTQQKFVRSPVAPVGTSEMRCVRKGSKHLGVDVISSYLKVRLGLTAAFAVVLFCLLAAQAAVVAGGQEDLAKPAANRSAHARRNVRLSADACGAAFISAASVC
jgi:hypothetical protein